MADLGSLTARIGLDTSALSSGFGQVQNLLGKVPPLALGVAGAVAGIGIAAFKIGENFDEAYDTIRVGTGKTGKELEGLKASFKNVVKDVPTDFGKASESVSTLAQRTNLTGKPLETMAKQLLEVSRITGTDLKTNLEGSTQLLANWNIPAEKSSGVLDKVFRASQLTGAGFGELMSITTQAGPIMRQLGFGLDETTALFGKLQKEGIDTGPVMMGMNKALSTLAKAGEEPKEAFNRLVGEIKNSTDPVHASQIAMELFGSRAGPRMAAAIREGRMEIGDLTQQIAGGKDTIIGAAKDTDDLAEKWTVLKNKAMVLIEPFASGLFNIIGKVFDGIVTAFEKVGEVWTFVTGLFTSKSGDTATSTSETWTKIKETIETVINVVKTVIETWVAIIQAIWERWGSDIIAYVQTAWNAVMTIIGGVLDVIKGIFNVFAGIFTGDWERVWDGIKGIFEGIWNVIKGIFQAALAGLTLIFKVALDVLKGIWEWIWNGIKEFFSNIWEGIKAAFSALWEAFSRLFTSALDRLKMTWSNAWNAVKDFLGGIWEKIKQGVRTGLDAVLTYFKEFPGNLVRGLGNIGELLVDTGKKILEGLWKGIKNAADWFKTQLINLLKAILPDAIEELLGISSPSKVFEGYGANVVEGMRKGIQSNLGALRATMGQMAGVVAGAEMSAGGNGRAITVAPGALQMTVSITGATEPGRITEELDRAGAMIVDRLLRELRSA